MWYKPKQPTLTPKPPTTGPPKVSSIKITWLLHFNDQANPLLTQLQTGVLAGLGAAAVARPAKAMLDLMDIWLSGGLVLEDGVPVNILKWWTNQKQGGITHHSLLQMALDHDVMCCPG